MKLSFIVAALLLAVSAGSAQAARPGASGIGDPYFPHAGNGGYDVRHYGLDIAYTPKTDGCAASRRSRRRPSRTCRASTSISTG